ncbi:serine/threonine-protein phosphatase PGAM5, mitochondrial [Petromyzon marinus]|uniref:Serine/threonine-protein phosphatase PGAM5, mitochondrial n=1 Tax=Petromyzon marinus TaxID=7757 RepID=A0AAJ7SPR9_PETMA|nr:serine/threonine-protein phosphatase PGAM5, mitochondrial [Petromyzon marinus]
MARRRAIGLACGLAASAAAVLVHRSTLDHPPSINVDAPPVKSAAPDKNPAVSTLASWDHNWDRRQSTFLAAKAKVKESTVNGVQEPVLNGKEKHRGTGATRHILLVRHSQYNLAGPTDEQRFLTDTGREQAELTGQRLASLGFPYTRIVHSSMRRAIETAQIISTHLPDVALSSSDLLREGMPIPPEPPMRPKPDFQYFTDGARIEAAFRQFIHRAEPEQQADSYEIIVCHANVIRYFVCRALQFPPEGWLRMSLDNGSITWLAVRPSGRVGLRSLGDSGFMPATKLTH